MEEKEQFTIAIQVNREGSSYKAKGTLTSGMVKIMIGELELIKLRLLADLEKSLDNEKPTQRFEFGDY